MIRAACYSLLLAGCLMSMGLLMPPIAQDTHTGANVLASWQEYSTTMAFDVWKPVVHPKRGRWADTSVYVRLAGWAAMAQAMTAISVSLGGFLLSLFHLSSQEYLMQLWTNLKAADWVWIVLIWLLMFAGFYIFALIKYIRETKDVHQPQPAPRQKRKRLQDQVHIEANTATYPAQVTIRPESGYWDSPVLYLLEGEYYGKLLAVGVEGDERLVQHDPSPFGTPERERKRDSKAWKEFPFGRRLTADRGFIIRVGEHAAVTNLNQYFPVFAKQFLKTGADAVPSQLRIQFRGSRCILEFVYDATERAYRFHSRQPLT